MAFTGPGWVLVQPSEGRVEAAGERRRGLLGNLGGVAGQFALTSVREVLR